MVGEVKILDAAAVDDEAGAGSVRILLLEDSPIDAELIESQLRTGDFGFTLTCVQDRAGFEQALESGGFDIVLSDFSLPGFDGMSALRLSRARAPALPFIFVSGVFGEEFATESLKQGATDYVLKQRLVRLPSAVQRALSEARERRVRKQIERRLRASLEALRESEDALRRLNENLEQRVEERTRALAAQVEEREKVEVALRQAQRMEAVGQLTSGVAHDFNNLLTIILGNIEFLQRHVTEEKSLQRLSFMRSAAERGAKLTGQLLAFSRRQKLEPEPVDLNRVVAGMSDLLRSTTGGSIEVRSTLDAALRPALVDPTQIELVILNLAINARDAMESGGTLTVATGNVTLTTPPRYAEEPGPGDYVVVSVTDTGTGMSQGLRAKVFEPFFTTKEVGKGSGLGLSQVLGFAKQSGGGVSIDTRLGEGTTVKVYLPCAADAAVEAPEAARRVDGAAQDSNGRTPRVLVVDDDAAVREITVTMLEELGYEVIQAGDGIDALAVLGEQPDVQLLVVDFAMPGMNGLELAQQAARLISDLRVLLVTGYANLADLSRIDDIFLLRKPFLEAELDRKVRAVLASEARQPLG